MELSLIAAASVVSIVGVAVFSRRIGVAAPLVLVIVGLALSFVPRVGHVEPEPELILAGVLPPLLYATAIRLPAIDFRRNLGPILGLAVLLTAATTLICGVVFNSLLTGLGMAGALALGAVISPTDPVAATAIGKRMHLPSRLLAILEGEGLVNDAAALVLLGSAVAATTGATHLTHIAGKFVYSVVVAIAIGWLVAEVCVRARARLHDPVLDTAASFAIPFLAYTPAEGVHASGVLAVVICGLVSGSRGSRYLDPRSRLDEAVNWTTISFLLENGVFLLLGLQLKTLLDHESEAGLSSGHAILIGLLASVLVIIVRFVFVVPIVSLIHVHASRAESQLPALAKLTEQIEGRSSKASEREREQRQALRRLRRKSADADFAVNENFGWRGGAVLGWAGMRGAITVAAAQSLPIHLKDRPQLLLIAFVVACVTLLAQGLSLPAVIRFVRLPGDDPAAVTAEYAELLGEMVSAGQAAVTAPSLRQRSGEPYPPELVERALDDLRIRVVAPETEADLDDDPRELLRELTLRALAAERATLLRLGESGRFSSQSVDRAERSLDGEQLRYERIAFFDADLDSVEPSPEPDHGR